MSRKRSKRVERMFGPAPKPGKNARKRSRKREDAQPVMNAEKRVSKRDAFKTGYTDPQIVAAAKRNPGGTGTQKSKRDKASWDGQGPRFFQGGLPGLGKRR